MQKKSSVISKTVDSMAPFNKSNNRFSSAKDRFLKPAIVNFFEQSFPKLFGSEIREKLADSIIELIEDVYPDRSRIKPGQMFWNALDKYTRADSAKRRYQPVVLTMISQQEIDQLLKGVSWPIVKQNVIARILKEADQQGGTLSMRDISLLMWIGNGYATKLRKDYEQKNNVILPHPGNLHDLGTCRTHKKMIVYKAIVEKKDPTKVAGETCHSQPAVDRYLKDFHRVKAVYKETEDVDYIHLVTDISKPVVKEYISIIEKHLNEKEKIC